ncbi:MAG: hypothetical protein K0B87_03285 [Candidatus Syntrophosphaera sp.]|nr:hypothetical protein [Candidatus Syntrophosphaera sp.]
MDSSKGQNGDNPGDPAGPTQNKEIAAGIEMNSPLDSRVVACRRIAKQQAMFDGILSFGIPDKELFPPFPQPVHH